MIKKLPRALSPLSLTLSLPTRKSYLHCCVRRSKHHGLAIRLVRLHLLLLLMVTPLLLLLLQLCRRLLFLELLSHLRHRCQFVQGLTPGGHSDLAQCRVRVQT